MRYDTGPFRVTLLDGPLIPIVGPELSTAKVALGPEAGAVFPARSAAVPAAIEIPKVPSPVMLLMVTVRELPVPLMPMLPLAVPVLFKVTSEGLRLEAEKLESA